MSAKPLSRSELSDSIADFGGLAFDAINKLSAEVRELRDENARLRAQLAREREELEELEREIREAL